MSSLAPIGRHAFHRVPFFASSFFLFLFRLSREGRVRGRPHRGRGGTRPYQRGRIQGSRFVFLPTLRLGLLALLLSSFCALASNAGLSANDFELANRLYGQGKFTEAAAAYERSLLSGQSSAAVYFNLGNAWFKTGQMGRALVAYRQAEELAPRDPDIRANLQFARNQVQGPSLPPDRVQRWLSRLTVNEWTGLAASALWGWLLLLAALQLRTKWRPALRSYALPLGIVVALLCLGLAAALYQARATRSAIVVARDAVVHTSPLEESNTSFTAHDGAELQVLDQKDEWLQVTADPRRLGWVRRDQVQLLPVVVSQKETKETKETKIIPHS